MKGIIAINKAGYIGLNNNLPWKSKTDFAHFRKMTLNSKLLVGYRTSLSLPYLDAREIIVMITMIYQLTIIKRIGVLVVKQPTNISVIDLQNYISLTLMTKPKGILWNQILEI